MLLGELVVVDAEHHGEVGTCAGRGDQHALGAGAQMLGRTVAVGETAGAFHDDIDSEIAPGQLLGRRFRQHGDILPVGLELAVGHGDLAGETSMHAVEFQEMGVHLGRAEVVDRHEIEIFAAGL